MRRFILLSLTVALIPLAVAVAEIIRTRGTSFMSASALSALSLLILSLLIPLQKERHMNHLTERFEILMMWFVVFLFALAIILRWGNVL
ncbi:MAG: hypothetical protein H5T47_00490 [Archaeoglobi archaeon]|nr:hypothetical protein [Candidatus Mnemosynella bozhongmuii]